MTRFLWQDPAVVLDEAATPEAFRAAMAAFLVGGTYKITGSARHPNADALLIENVDLSGAFILDIGASDGSTSRDLIEKVPNFGSYVISDLYPVVGAARAAQRVLFYEPDGKCFLVAGPRWVGWPGTTKFVGLLYRHVIGKAARSGTHHQDVLLLNPSVRELVASDPRVSWTIHDVFQPWEGPPPDVIKVANLLRRLYFDDQRICVALGTLLHNLPDGGHLLVVDNPRDIGTGPRAALYRRAGERFDLVDRTDAEPEIADLVPKVRLDR
jgi:hypothetical protein